MSKAGTEAIVARLPKCDVHNGAHDAQYDASIIPPGYTRRVWANVCEEAFKEFDGHLGLGRGQRLVVVGTER